MSWSRQLLRCSDTGKRLFSSSSPLRSYIGSTPIPIPPNIQLQRTEEETLIINGPLGSTTLSMPKFMRFQLPSTTVDEGGAPKKKRRNPPCPTTATALPFTFTSPTTAPSTETETPPQEITLFVEDPTEKSQRMLWGTLRTLLQNAIKGQTEGFTLPIYLIGVGYRAALEQDTRRLPDGHKDVVASGGADAPRQRLAMKLGFSHTVYVSVPSDVKVTVPTPTIISLWGRDKRKVGQFAANVRGWRKPEVYKGKVSCPVFWMNAILRFSCIGCFRW